MDNIVNKIIQIDKKALDLRNKIEKLVEANELKLEKKLKEIEEAQLKIAREEGKKKYEILIKEGEIENKDIVHRAEQKCEQLEKKYKSVHKQIKEEIFSKIFET